MVFSAFGRMPRLRHYGDTTIVANKLQLQYLIELRYYDEAKISA